MNGLVHFTQFQAEALLICLAGSLIWAGLLLFGARGLERASATASTEKLWIAALFFAVLPSLAAPTLAAFGISLRPGEAPAVNLPMHEPVEGAAQTITEAAAATATASLSVDQIVSAAALIYVYGVFLTFFLWAIRHAVLRFAVARAEPAICETLLDLVDDWAERLDVSFPEIKRSRHVSSVCITGIVRQTILIPRDIETRVSTSDLALMCAHELAHVRRGDTRLFTATQLARVLFWFNPLVSQIASRVELAAEESADALVIRAGVDRRAYAACFVEGLKFAAYKMNAQLVPAPSFTPPDRFGRRRRLNSILSIETPQKAPLGKRLLLSAAASTMALAAFGQAALAVDPESALERRSVLRSLPLVGDVTLGFEASLPAEIDAAKPKHQGLDIKAAKGAKIIAPGDGIVLEATDLYRGSSAWGKVVVIDHGHGLVTRYAHLDGYAVKKGQRVKAGDVIAVVGETGKTTGPHLHFETLQDGEPVSPTNVIAALPTVPAAPAASPVRSVPALAPVGPEKPVFAHELATLAEIPGVPGMRQFTPAEIRSGFQFADPVIAADDAFEENSDPHRLPDRFMFSGGASNEALIDDLEGRLLGALNGENGGSFNLTFRNGDEVFHFSSAEPMTAEQRAEMHEALQDARKQMAKARKEAEKQQKEIRKELVRAKIDADHEASLAAAERRRWSDEEIARFRDESLLTRQEMLTIQRDALEDALDNMDTIVETAAEDALADLDDFDAEIEEINISREERAAMRASIRQQRRELQRNSGSQRRIAEARREKLDRQIDEIERQLEAIDNQRNNGR